MAKKRKKKPKKTFTIGFFGKKKQKTRSSKTGFLIFLKTFAILCTAAAIAVGFVFLKEYVITSSEKTAFLQFSNVPSWVSEPLKNKVYSAAMVDGEDLKIDEDAAFSVQQNIESLIGWLYNIQVQTTHDCIIVDAKWRKPVAIIQSGTGKFYLDADMVALDYLPVINLPVVKINGLSNITQPTIGQRLYQKDIAAAIEILIQLSRMDELVTPNKPLLKEISSIDVTNFSGRKNHRLAHIVLYTTDNTEIIWGAEFGCWQRNMEATDEEKIAKLYSYYEEYGSLLGGVKYINIREPQDNISQPIDKY